VGTIRWTARGIEMTSRGTVPGTSLSSVSGFSIGLLLPAVQSARQAARREQSMNNLKQIALAMLNYADTNGRLPPAYIADKTTGKPLLSWRVAILPYIEEQALYQQFHLDEPWDSPNNKRLISTMPTIYRSPASQLPLPQGKANYLTFRSKDSVFPGKDGISPAEITDGMSHTLMTVEVDDAKAVDWTKPDDLDYDPQRPFAGLGGLWNTGFIAGFCDGSVQFISTSVDAETLRNLVNRHDGNVTNLP
jgi:type II secretory pathway pseudopilin PulG